jgi:hypothetical protein
MLLALPVFLCFVMLLMLIASSQQPAAVLFIAIA